MGQISSTLLLDFGLLARIIQNNSKESRFNLSFNCIGVISFRLSYKIFGANKSVPSNICGH